MKILVTGANGFIGKSIVDFLIKTKHFEIIATDIQESYQGNAVCPYVSMDITSDNFLNIFLIVSVFVITRLIMKEQRIFL